MDYKGSNVETLTHTKKVMLDRANKPFTALNDGPFRTSLDKMDGVFRKEVVSYRVSNGFLYKETAVRHFSDGDYNDTVTTETLHHPDVEKSWDA